MSTGYLLLDKNSFNGYIECMENYKKEHARLHCANWDAGKCIGCDVRTEDTTLVLYIDSKKADKECVIDEGCGYFDRVAVPGIV